MQHKRYILVSLSIFSLICISAISLSFYANPYDIDSVFYPKESISYFGGTRTAKAAHIIEGNYDAFILGSSRSEIGINPRHSLWGTFKTYNASLAGSNFIETHKVFKTIIKHKKPKLILLALDYSLFSRSRSTSADFNLSRFDDSNSSFSSFFKEHLSKESIEKSFRTLKYTKNELPAKHRQGQKIGQLTFLNTIRKNGQHNLIFSTLEKKVIHNDEAYSSKGYSVRKLSLLHELVQTCVDQKIKLIIIISPIHALQLMAFKQMGIWDDFLSWKKKLTSISSTPNKIPLYDFTDLSTFISEKVPTHKNSTTMQWFWETSHYNEPMGNLILSRVLNPSSPIKKSFGIKLTHNNVDHEINKQRIKLDLYEQENSNLRSKILALIKPRN